MIDDLEVIAALAEALRAGGPWPEMVRRCAEHHVPLEGLDCPEGHTLIDDGWEVYDPARDQVFYVVRGDWTVENVAAPDVDSQLRLAGRDHSGLTEELSARARRMQERQASAPNHRARQDAGRLSETPRELVTVGSFRRSHRCKTHARPGRRPAA